MGNELVLAADVHKKGYTHSIILESEEWSQLDTSNNRAGVRVRLSKMNGEMNEPQAEVEAKGKR